MKEINTDWYTGSTKIVDSKYEGKENWRASFVSFIRMWTDLHSWILGCDT